MKTSLLLSILLAVACSSSPKTSTTEQPGDTGAGTGADTTGAGDQTPDRPGRGQPCGADDACDSGLECVSYYGIAGPSGPQFKSCETRCDAKQTCPEGTSCTTISDGPGRVCR